MIVGNRKHCGKLQEKQNYRYFLPLFIVLNNAQQEEFWWYMEKFCSYGVYFTSVTIAQHSISHCQIELAVVHIVDVFKTILSLIMRRSKIWKKMIIIHTPLVLSVCFLHELNPSYKVTLSKMNGGEWSRKSGLLSHSQVSTSKVKILTYR